MRRLFIGVLVCILLLAYPAISLAYSGYSYTNNEAVADALSGIMNGTTPIFDGEGGYAVGKSIGQGIHYYGNRSYSGYTCFVYANAVFYKIFGYSPQYGGSNVASNVGTKSVSYNSLKNAGVKCGTYMRTGSTNDGHSIIVLAYDSSSVTWLDANWSNDGVIKIHTESYSFFNTWYINYQNRTLTRVVIPQYNENPSPDHGPYNIYGNTSSGSTIFYVNSTSSNSYIYLKSEKGTAIVNQHTMGVYSGQGEEKHHGFYYVSVAYVDGQYRHDFVWAPSATTSDGRIELNTEEQPRISFSSAGVFRVEVKPMSSSEASKYWRVDSLDHWKTAAKWYVNTTSNCSLRKDAVKIEFNLPNGNGVPNGNLPKGKAYELRGVVKASESIKSIKGTIYEAGTGKIVSGIGTNPITINPNSTSVDIYTSQINYSLKFNNLKDGMYRYELVVTTSSGWTQTVADSTFTVGNARIPGDANGDGVVDNIDALMVLRYDSGWRNFNINLSNSDVNGDGHVDNIDAMRIMLYVCGWPITFTLK